MANYPCADKEGKCLYCGSKIKSCWCGAVHICLDCRERHCVCDNRKKQALDMENFIRAHVVIDTEQARYLAKMLVQYYLFSRKT